MTRLALLAFLGAVAAPAAARDAACGPASGRIVVLSPGPALAGLVPALREAGFTVREEPFRRRRQAERAAEREPFEAPGGGDLFLVSAPPRGGRWEAAHFELLRGRKVLALGSGGAAFLGEGKLLIGDPNGWHGKGARALDVPGELAGGPFARLLGEPCRVRAPVAGGVAQVVVQPPGPAHTAIYDEGGFADGTVGLARERSDGRHWLVAKQGDFALWGIDGSPAALGPEAMRFFVNLCQALIRAPSEPVRFPERPRLTARGAAGTLRGGARATYLLSEPGAHRVTLSWDGKETMMLRAGGDRADGRSPLRLDVAVRGEPLEIVVGSFELPPGARRPFRLALEPRRYSVER